jgi:Ca2+-binding EF-hand superfamily protein
VSNDKGLDHGLPTQNSLNEDEARHCEKLGISHAEYLELREVFRLVDLDSGGTISKDELEMLMRTLGLHVSKDELQSMVDEIVAPGCEEIDLKCTNL